MWHGDWTGADWLLMSLGMLIFWSVVVAGIVWLVRSVGSAERSRHDGAPQRDETVSLDKSAQHTETPGETGRASAREILDERYARGEISDEEYRNRRDNLAAR